MTPKEYATRAMDNIVIDDEVCSMAGRHRDQYIEAIEREIKAAVFAAEEQAVYNARQAAIAQEREDCVRLLTEARKLYERYMHEAQEAEYGIGKDPSRPHVKAHEWFAKITAIEYAILVIRDWRDSEHYKEGHLPLPF